MQSSFHNLKKYFISNLKPVKMACSIEVLNKTSWSLINLAICQWDKSISDETTAEATTFTKSSILKTQLFIVHVIIFAFA